VELFQQHPADKMAQGAANRALRSVEVAPSAAQPPTMKAKATPKPDDKSKPGDDAPVEY
jgi:hypothetical protein